MKFVLHALIALSATASPQAPLSPPFGGPIVKASSPVFARQMALWEDSQTRLEVLGDELDTILEDVIVVERADLRALDPLLVELYVRKGDLEEILLLSVEGYREGHINSSADIQALQEMLDAEIRALEEAVLVFRTALDNYLTGVIEV